MPPHDTQRDPNKFTNEGAMIFHINSSGIVDWARKAYSANIWPYRSRQQFGGNIQRSPKLGMVTDGEGGAILTYSGTYPQGHIWAPLAMRISASGSVKWAIKLATGVHADRNSALIASNGHAQWPYQYTSTIDPYTRGIAADAAGGALITGQFQGLVTFGTHILRSSYMRNTFVLRVSGGGEISWAVNPTRTPYIAPSEHNGRSSLIASDGTGVLLSGRLETALTFGETTLTPTSRVRTTHANFHQFYQHQVNNREGFYPHGRASNFLLRLAPPHAPPPVPPMPPPTPPHPPAPPPTPPNPPSPPLPPSPPTDQLVSTADQLLSAVADERVRRIIVSPGEYLLERSYVGRVHQLPVCPSHTAICVNRSLIIEASVYGSVVLNSTALAPEIRRTLYVYAPADQSVVIRGINITGGCTSPRFERCYTWQGP